MALANFDIELVKFQRTITLAKSNFIPEYGSEIFVTNLPSYVSDEELVTFFQTAGNVFKIKLMLQDQNKNRGYCYVTYMDPDMARLAVDILNRIPFKGIYLKIKKPLENCRIFLGGIPTDKTKDSVWQELLKIGAKNIVDVIMYRAYDDRAKNRGFVFVQFTTHEEAAYFRAKYYDVLQLWGRKVVIDWSVPLPEVTDDILDKVKIIYLRNLNIIQSPQELEAIIYQFTNKKNIQKVYKFKNYAFIHVKTRELAEMLMNSLKAHYKDGPVEVEWSKPPCLQTSREYRQFKVCNFSKPRSSTSSSLSSTPEEVHFLPSATSIRERENLPTNKHNYLSPEHLISQRTPGSNSSTEAFNRNTFSNEFFGDYMGPSNFVNIENKKYSNSFGMPIYNDINVPFRNEFPRSNTSFYSARSSTPNLLIQNSPTEVYMLPAKVWSTSTSLVNEPSTSRVFTPNNSLLETSGNSSNQASTSHDSCVSIIVKKLETPNEE